jgi:hypothetical protein
MNSLISQPRSGCSQLALAALLVASATVAFASDPSAPNASSEPRGHQMRRYQSFARQAELPPITIAGDTALTVGSVNTLDTSRLAQVPAQDLDALANQFAVPSGVIANLTRPATGTAAPTAAQFAQQLRTAVIDYRFLHGEWDRYHPPQAGQQTRTDALQALQAGDIATAWALYDTLGLPPAPTTAPPLAPGNLRVVAGP